MKNILVFDIDGTLYDDKADVVPVSTVDTIRELSKNKDNILVIATGRAYYHSHGIEDLLEYFEFRIQNNGQILFKSDEIIGGKPFSKDFLDEVDNYFTKNMISCGYCGIDKSSYNMMPKKLSNLLTN